MDPRPIRDPAVAAPPPGGPVACPFHDGPQTLDLLLGELRRDSPELLDLALELRTAMTAGSDAAHCVELLLALRARLASRHHLAFYRVRTWVQRRIVAEVRPDRASPWRACPLPLDCARVDELRNRCLATLATADDASWPPTAYFRLRFTAAPPAQAGA